MKTLYCKLSEENINAFRSKFNKNNTHESKSLSLLTYPDICI